jgi:GDP-L-fucose synthase
MNIFISGSNGFIAKHLSNHLKEHNLYKHTRKDFDLTNTIETKNFFKNNNFDIVIHTAIKGGSRLEEDEKNLCYDNVIMAMNLIDNKKNFKRLIHFGSGAELDRSRSIDENVSNVYSCVPKDSYGLSKNIIARLFNEYDEMYNLRIFNVFAEDEADRRMIKSNVINYINNNSMVIHQDKFMDFMYVKDFLKIIDLYLKNIQLPKTTDCVYDQKYKLSDIAEIINNLSDYKVNIDLLDTQLGNSYCGRKNNLGLNFDGLEISIKNIYERYLNEKFIN